MLYPVTVCSFNFLSPFLSLTLPFLFSLSHTHHHQYSPMRILTTQGTNVSLCELPMSAKERSFLTLNNYVQLAIEAKYAWKVEGRIGHRGGMGGVGWIYITRKYFPIIMVIMWLVWHALAKQLNTFRCDFLWHNNIITGGKTAVEQQKHKHSPEIIHIGKKYTQYTQWEITLDKPMIWWSWGEAMKKMGMMNVYTVHKY